MQTEAEKRLENRNIPEAKDLTGSQNQPEPTPVVVYATPEDTGINELVKSAGIEVGSPDPDEGTVNDAANDHRLYAAGGDVDPYEGRKKDIPEEVEITHLRHPTTGIVFPVNADIIKQKHLRPCDEKGKLVHDGRIFNRFN